MRMVMVAAVALALPAWAGDIYRWTDADGHVHVSNRPTAGTGRGDSAPPSAEPTDDEDGDGSSPGSPKGAGGEAFSASASLRRNALERDLRATERKLRELDARLTSLARARGERADAARATSGVGTNLGVRSEEEKALTTEREQLAQHAAEVRSAGAQLREEVTMHSGGVTPDWWVDIR